MIQFKSLRLSGFKSFVDRTELDIGKGLNGIVGPNGCGKSNLVEALKWVMGESSAKKMRGSGMEDVIFNGTATRPARNIAEVSLLIDNTTRTAPAAYNNSDDIEITRRIEKDYGSTYKINGKTVRARDVNMLLADTATGSSSPALVSQGRITQIITAKPLERRLILEDSAGISGLFARRHEAELRLRAADKNLQRIEDISGSMEGRLNSLKRQARQAAKYSNLNAQIRQLDILIAYLEWSELNRKSAALKKEFGEQESLAAEKLATVAQLTKTQTTQAADLPALRKTETEFAAALQRQKLTLEQQQADLRRRKQALKEVKEQLERTGADHAHETTSLAENDALFTRLEAEQKTILSDEETHDARLEEKRTLRDDLEIQVGALEQNYTAIMQSTAEAKAERQAITARITRNTERREVLSARISSMQESLQEIEALGKDDGGLADKELEIKTISATLEALVTALNSSQSTQDSLEREIATARDAAEQTRKAQNEFDSELAALERLYQNTQDESQSLLNDVRADSGFELALSRALGDSLLASLDKDANNFWVKINQAALPALPNGAEALLPRVNAPEELHIALSQIAYVEASADGFALQAKLKPGQSIVSGAGDYWRWDGYCIKAQAQDRNALYLEQKNKLQELQGQKEGVHAKASKAQTVLEALLKQEAELRASIKERASKRQDAQNALSALQNSITNLREERAAKDGKRSSLEQNLQTSQDDLAALEATQKDDEAALEAFEEQRTEEKEAQAETLHKELQDLRLKYQDALRAFDRFEQEQRTRKARLQAIADERVTLQNRMIRSKEYVKTLSARQTDLQARLEAMLVEEADTPEHDQALLDKISELDTARNAAAEKLQQAESDVSETSRGLKVAEQALGEIREKRAGIQATLSAVQEQIIEKTNDIQSNFEMAPAALKTHITRSEDELGTASADAFRTEKDKLSRERDMLGAVNLRAEDEALELEKEVGAMLSERNDLNEAIAELRGGIQTINDEARTRLTAAFDHVNAHFQDLFGRLFKGGKAHLALVDADDPLESGLEIFAQPPGKTLQSLSLLSGGEQTLAAIALIFAMFLTNPSPVCVLDEIDAPLDDANVDRVCDLLDEISERGATRFIIVTHHRLTMARMDRLYGVTMAEKGVSQLVSVDLQQSFDFVEAA